MNALTRVLSAAFVALLCGARRVARRHVGDAGGRRQPGRRRPAPRPDRRAARGHHPPERSRLEDDVPAVLAHDVERRQGPARDLPRPRGRRLQRPGRPRHSSPTSASIRTRTARAPSSAAWTSTRPSRPGRLHDLPRDPQPLPLRGLRPVRALPGEVGRPQGDLGQGLVLRRRHPQHPPGIPAPPRIPTTSSGTASRTRGSTASPSAGRTSTASSTPGQEFDVSDRKPGPLLPGRQDRPGRPPRGDRDGRRGQQRPDGPDPREQEERDGVRQAGTDRRRALRAARRP